MSYGIPDDPTKEDILRILIDESIWVCAHEFAQMSDYSRSIPSGVEVGKFWKRRRDYHDDNKGWVLGEYEQHPTEKDLAVVRWHGLIVCGHRSQLHCSVDRHKWIKDQWKNRPYPAEFLGVVATRSGREYAVYR